MKPTQNIIDFFSTLSHDMKNDFAIIRAISQHIQKQPDEQFSYHKKIEILNNAVTAAVTRLESMDNFLSAWRKMPR